MHPTHPGRRLWPTVLLVVTALLLALFAVVLVAPPVGAHALGRSDADAQARLDRFDDLDDPDLPGGA